MPFFGFILEWLVEVPPVRGTRRIAANKKTPPGAMLCKTYKPDLSVLIVIGVCLQAISPMRKEYGIDSAPSSTSFYVHKADSDRSYSSSKSHYKW